MGAYVMEIQSYSFRSALSGFHRGDVISFLEKLSASHEAELRQRDEQIRVLREDLARANAALEQAQAENEQLRCRREPEADAPRPEAPDETDPSRALEAYRRAERCEREAKARSGKLCADASEAVRRAGRQIEDQQARMYSAADALSADFAAMKTAMTGILGEMNDARDRLAQMERDLAAED